MAGPLDVAIHLTATNGVSSILGVIAKDVLGVHGNVEKLQGSLSKLKVALFGVGSAMAGIALFKGLEKFEAAGEKLVHVKTVFEAALPAQERMASMALITASAWKEAGTNMQSNIVENVEALHDLYNVTQSVGHATELLSGFNILKNAYASVKDTESVGHSADGRNVASAVRAFELTGRNTAEAISKVAEEFTRTTVALRGRVAGTALLTQISNAGDSRYGWTDDFLSHVLPAMIATGLQNRTGSALNAGSNNLYGGVSSSVLQMQNQIKWGLHSDSDWMDPAHKKPGFNVGTMWKANDFRENPLTWANEYREMLKTQKGVDVNNPKTMQDIIGEIGRGNKLLKAELDELLLPQTNRQLNKEVGNIKNVGADAMGIVSANDPVAIRGAMVAQWNNALEGVGEQLVKPMLDNIIKPLTVVLRDVSQFAAAHPGEVALMGKGLLILSAGLVGLGVALVGGALLAAIGTGGWLVVGISALAAAIALIKPGLFQDIIAGFRQAMDGFKSLDFVAVISGIAKIFNAELLGLPGMVAGAIGSAFASIGSSIAGAISGLGAGLTGAGGQGRGHTPVGQAPHQKQGMAAPIPSRSKVAMIEFHHTSVLDNRKVAQSVTRHQVAMAEHPNSIGAMDSYGTHAGPGTDLPAWG